MNHWTLVALDIWKVAKYLLPFVGSCFVIYGINNSDFKVGEERKIMWAYFVFLIGMLLYVVGML